MENENKIFKLSKLETDSIFLIGYMALFDSVMKVYFYTDIRDIYKVNFDDEYKFIYFTILDLLDTNQEFKDIKKDFLDQFNDLTSLILSEDEISTIIGNSELFWGSSNYLKTFDNVLNLQYKLKLSYNLLDLIDKFGNNGMLSKEEYPELSDEIINNTNLLIKKINDFIFVRMSLSQKLVIYGNYIFQKYNSLFGIKTKEPLVVLIEDKGLTLNSNNGEVKNNGILLGKLNLNTQEYKLFDCLLKNKGVFLTYDEILKIMFDKEKHVIQKLNSSFIQDLKRKLPPEIKKLIVAEKGGYIVP